MPWSRALSLVCVVALNSIDGVRESTPYRRFIVRGRPHTHLSRPDPQRLRWPHPGVNPTPSPQLRTWDLGPGKADDHLIPPSLAPSHHRSSQLPNKLRTILLSFGFDSIVAVCLCVQAGSDDQFVAVVGLGAAPWRRWQFLGHALSCRAHSNLRAAPPTGQLQFRALPLRLVRGISAAV